jgi:mannose-6-phosphate isomerase
MNYLVLQPNEGVYVPANGTHAWLSGDIVGNMARSDNVLDTGFGPHADRDGIDLFISALIFNPHSAE